MSQTDVNLFIQEGQWVFSLTALTSDYIIEKEPLVNKFISVPKDKGENRLMIIWRLVHILENTNKFILPLLACTCSLLNPWHCEKRVNYHFSQHQEKLEKSVFKIVWFWKLYSWAYQLDIFSNNTFLNFF